MCVRVWVMVVPIETSNLINLLQIISLLLDLHCYVGGQLAMDVLNNSSP